SAIPRQALLTVAGSGMLGVPGIAARTFAAVHHEGISVSLITQASSEHSICFSVPEESAERARKSLEETFRPAIARQEIDGVEVHPERTDVVLLGFGQTGRTLAPMIAKVKQDSLTLRIVGLIDTSGLVFDARGLSPRRLAALAAAKAKGTPLAKATGGRRASAAEAVGFVARHALANPVLVDLTADDTTDTIKAALGAGMHVVLANKRPVTADKRRYDALRAAAQTHGRRLLHEATVGAGLPIIDTYQKLVDSGDRVAKIEGCPSGTLG